MKLHLVTLGCSKNTVDSEGLAADFVKRGWKWEPDPLKADLILLNTCGFIKDAKEESLAKTMQLLSLKKDHAKLKVGVFGCLVKRYHQEISSQIPELDFLFDFASPEILQNIETQMGFSRPHVSSKTLCAPTVRRFTPSHFGYLKIAEGCDNRCTYCAIPDIRGPFQSKKLDALLQESENLVKSGARELIVVAQDTTRYGMETGKPSLLPELLRKLGELAPLHWIRLQYLHPKRLSFDFIDQCFTLPKVLPYFDIPFQHVSDQVLERMNRSVTKKTLVGLMKHIRKNFPEATIRSTLIVGFPGETDADFDELIEFIERYPIDRLGAFAYSPEEGTPAQHLKPRITKAVKTRRLDELMTLQQLISQERNDLLIGKTIEVLVDKIATGKAAGRTRGDSPEVDNLVTLKYNNRFSVGDFIQVTITSAEAYDLTGKHVP